MVCHSFSRDHTLSENFHRARETETLGGHNKTVCAPGPRIKDQQPHKRLTKTGLSVLGNLWQRQGSTVACHGVRGTDHNSPGRLA